MSEPLELQAQRPYALDQLTMLQSQIMQTIQGMVVLRARIEKQRRSNIEAARDTYTELDRARERLIEQLSKSELFLLEMEEYPLAAAADQLRRGLAGFNLMSMGYKPIYEALARFTASFPTGQKTNAAIVGRLMNNITTPSLWTARLLSTSSPARLLPPLGSRSRTLPRAAPACSRMAPMQPMQARLMRIRL